MNNLKKQLLTYLLMFCSGVAVYAGQRYEPTWADSISGNVDVSLSQARTIALENNRSLRNSSLQVRQAQASRWQTIASMLPQVDANLTYTNMCGYTLNFGVMQRDMPPYGQLGITAAIALTGSQIVGALISEVAIKMQKESYEVAEDQLLANVAQVYTSVLVMQEVDTLLKQSLDNILKLQTMTDRAVEVGVSEQTVADQMAVRVATLRQNINSTERTLQVQINSLKLLLGFGDDVQLNLTDKLDDVISPERVLSLLGEDFDLAGNRSYRLAQLNTDLAKKNKVLAWMAYTPTLTLAYQYAKQHYFSDTEGFSMTPPNTVQIGLAVPIWSSGKRAAAVREKKLAYEATLNTLEDTKNQLAVQFSQLRYNLNSTYESYVIEKENLAVNQRVLESTTNKFKYGVASTQELITSSNEFINAQSQYVNAVLSLVQAETNLEVFLSKK